MPGQAFKEAKQQLAHWRKGLALATKLAQPDRIAVCERFIKQCEVVISALEQVASKDK